MKCASIFAIFVILFSCSPRKRSVQIGNGDDNKKTDRPEELTDAKHEVVALGDKFTIDLPADETGVSQWNVVYDKKMFSLKKTASEPYCMGLTCLSADGYQFTASRLGETLITFKFKEKTKLVLTVNKKILVVEKGDYGNPDTRLIDAMLDTYLKMVPEKLSLVYQNTAQFKLNALPKSHQYRFTANPAGFAISQQKQDDAHMITVEPRAVGSSEIMLAIVDADLQEQATLRIPVVVRFAQDYQLKVGNTLLIQTFPATWHFVADGGLVNITTLEQCTTADCIGKHTLEAKSAGKAKVVFHAGSEQYPLTVSVLK